MQFIRSWTSFLATDHDPYKRSHARWRFTAACGFRLGAARHLAIRLPHSEQGQAKSSTETTSTGPLGVLTVIVSERFATALPAIGGSSSQDTVANTPIKLGDPDEEHGHFLILSPAPDGRRRARAGGSEAVRAAPADAWAVPAGAVASTGAAHLRAPATTTSRPEHRASRPQSVASKRSRL